METIIPRGLSSVIQRRLYVIRARHRLQHFRRRVVQQFAHHRLKCPDSVQVRDEVVIQRPDFGPGLRQRVLAHEKPLWLVGRSS
jgi:hypothetical protein